MSQISDQLVRSAVHIGEVPSGALLLKDNALYPWFLIVPHGDFVEWGDLPNDLQLKLLKDINTLSDFLSCDTELGVEKTNIASIGNIVPQFHLHIVGRNAKDPAWPGPVWGHEAERAYEAGEMEGLVERLNISNSDFSPL